MKKRFVFGVFVVLALVFAFFLFFSRVSQAQGPDISPVDPLAARAENPQHPVAAGEYNDPEAEPIACHVRQREEHPEAVALHPHWNPDGAPGRLPTPQGEYTVHSLDGQPLRGTEPAPVIGPEVNEPPLT